MPKCIIKGTAPLGAELMQGREQRWMAVPDGRQVLGLCMGLIQLTRTKDFEMAIVVGYLTFVLR
jgi:hypothetical protein